MWPACAAMPVRLADLAVRREHDALPRAGQYRLVRVGCVIQRKDLLVFYRKGFQRARFKSRFQFVENVGTMPRIERKRVDPNELVPSSVERKDVERYSP